MGASKSWSLSPRTDGQSARAARNGSQPPNDARSEVVDARHRDTQPRSSTSRRCRRGRGRLQRQAVLTAAPTEAAQSKVSGALPCSISPSSGSAPRAASATSNAATGYADHASRPPRRKNLGRLGNPRLQPQHPRHPHPRQHSTPDGSRAESPPEPAATPTERGRSSFTHHPTIYPRKYLADNKPGDGGGALILAPQSRAGRGPERSGDRPRRFLATIQPRPDPGKGRGAPGGAPRCFVVGRGGGLVRCG